MRARSGSLSIKSAKLLFIAATCAIAARVVRVAMPNSTSSYSTSCQVPGLMLSMTPGVQVSNQHRGKAVERD
jgi:hypothetical protein